MLDQRADTVNGRHPQDIASSATLLRAHQRSRLSRPVAAFVPRPSHADSTIRSLSGPVAVRINR